MNDYDLCAHTETQMQLLSRRRLPPPAPAPVRRVLPLICVVWAGRAFKICHPAKCLKALERELQQQGSEKQQQPEQQQQVNPGGETPLKQLMIYHHVGSRSCHWVATTLDAKS